MYVTSKRYPRAQTAFMDQVNLNPKPCSLSACLPGPIITPYVAYRKGVQYHNLQPLQYPSRVSAQSFFNEMK